MGLIITLSLTIRNQITKCSRRAVRAKSVAWPLDLARTAQQERIAIR